MYYKYDLLMCSEYGISRSATMVLAYVMKAEKLTFKQALEQVQVKKPDIRFDCVVVACFMFIQRAAGKYILKTNL